MEQYCEVCGRVFDEKRCPKCGRKSVRSVTPDDLCFLTEQEVLWSDMLADVLKQEGIPFTQKKVLGAGLAIKTGPMRERVRFFVFYRQLPEASAIVEELFSQAEEADGDL
ncbi:MAG: hypothetical protein J5938_06760 [Clostridia bacterium]|nr:hypothetical protein [Clostridia bacterium]MBO4797216.1 hypothetical protein [Candidatus Methanomethylophilaceae archaeon]MBQ4290966.1 hypothetical protein [Clostridia bacterium]